MKDNAIQPPKPLSISEAAGFTGLKPSYLYKLIHLKRIPYYKPTGGRVYFKREDLEAFIFRGRQASDYELLEEAGKESTVNREKDER